MIAMMSAVDDGREPPDGRPADVEDRGSRTVGITQILRPPLETRTTARPGSEDVQKK
jgi:hypothetical protein